MVMAYEDRDGNNVAVRPNTPAPVTLPGKTGFDEAIVAEFSPLIELDSSNGLSTALRDTVVTAGSGSVTNANGEHVLSTGATASSTASLETKERGRYQPGIEGLPGLAVRRATPPTGEQEIRWGYYDDTDGFWFGEDATGLFVRYRSGGVTGAKVYQSNWNGDDRLDGSGPSGVTLDLTRVTVFRMPFIWYGGGPVQMSVKATDTEGRSHYVVVHRFRGEAGSPLLANAKLPVKAEAVNGATAADMALSVCGRQFAVIGRYEPNRRTTFETNTGVSVAGGATIPLVSFRKKSARVSETKSVKINSLSALADQGGFLKVYLAPTLTGASFGTLSEVSADETAVEADTAATAISGGNLIQATPVAAGNGNSVSDAVTASLGLDLPAGTIITLAFQNVSGTSATVDAAFSVREEW